MKAYTFDTGLKGLGDFIHSEYDPTFTTSKMTVKAGSGAARVLAALCLVAAVSTTAATATAGAVVSASGGTPGNGAVSSLTADIGAMEGDWQIVFIEPESDAGVFQVFRPDGVLDGAGKVGVAYNGGINFSVADGSNNFVQGDRIPVAVVYAADTRKLVQWDPTAVNGAQHIIGVNCYDQEAADGVDGPEAPYLARGPIVGRREAIVWHSGATTAQKNAAYAALSKLGIEARISG